VLVVSVPAFAAETTAPAAPAGPKTPAAFSFAYGIFIPGPGTPIQLTGGDMPGASLGGGADKTKSPAAYSFAYGIYIPVQGTPIQLTGGDMPSATPLCK